MIYRPVGIKWKRAINRALIHNVEARFMLISSSQDCCVETWVTTSTGHPSALQQVGIVWTSDGLASVGCTCRTAQQGKPCQHAAAAVLTAYETTMQDAVFESVEDGPVTVVEGVWEAGYAIPEPMAGTLADGRLVVA